MCNTVQVKGDVKTVDMQNKQQVGELFIPLSKKVVGKIQPNPDKYIIMMAQDAPGPVDSANEMLSDMFGGYNAFGQDTRIIDPKTIVRNLKTDRLEVREKIFVDKPVKKQLELSLEEDGRAAGRAGKNANQGYFSSELVAQQYARGPQAQTFVNKSGGPDRFESGDDFEEEEKKTEARTYKLEEDFLYGLKTGSILQEWPVIKFNKKNKPKERVLCIDGFHIRHRKVNVERGFFSSFMPSNLLKGNSGKQKPISSIAFTERKKLVEFWIYYKDKKVVRYRTQNPSDCSEILAKLKFLRGG